MIACVNTIGCKGCGNEEERRDGAVADQLLLLEVDDNKVIATVVPAQAGTQRLLRVGTTQRNERDDTGFPRARERHCA